MARTSTDRLNRVRIPPAPDQFVEIGGYGLADDTRKNAKITNARLTPRLAAKGRCCRTKIFGGTRSNIDSESASDAQVRFKKSTLMIRLLCVLRMPLTFSTASVKGCLRDYVGITTGVPRIAADLLQRPSRQFRTPALQKHTPGRAYFGAFLFRTRRC